MPNFTNSFHYDDLNAPVLSGQQGSAAMVLRECLFDGYGKDSIPVTSITRSGTTATVTLSATDLMRFKVNSIITISGATGGDASLYNGSFAVASIASTTTLTYTMAGTPTGSATGTLLASKKLPITSITNVGNIATATLANNNLTLNAWDHVTIAGATGGDATYYNGTFQLLAVTGPNQFTYTMTGTPSGSATGTLTYHKAGLGWTLEFENVAHTIVAFRTAVVSGVGRHYLRVDDSGTVTTAAAKECIATGFETMTSESSGTGLFPNVQIIAAQTAALHPGYNWRKSTTADTTSREWHLAGDGRCMYLFPNSESNVSGPLATGGGRIPWVFAEGTPLRAGDTDACVISGNSNFNSPTYGGGGAANGGLSSSFTNLSGIYATFPSGACTSRLSSGVAIATAIMCTANGAPGSSSSAATGVGSQSTGWSTIPYPHPLDGGLWCTQCMFSEWNNAVWVPRAVLPGLYTHLHTVWPAEHTAKMTNVNGAPAGAVLQAFNANGYISGNGGGLWFVDVSGPAWY